MFDLLYDLLDRLRPLRLMRWLALGVGCLALWVLINVTPLREYLRLNEELRNHRDTTHRLEQERLNLERERDELQRGDFAAEKAARERLQLIRPGEKIFFIESEPTPAPEP